MGDGITRGIPNGLIGNYASGNGLSISKLIVDLYLIIFASTLFNSLKIEIKRKNHAYYLLDSGYV